jgi:hypothetical protein
MAPCYHPATFNCCAATSRLIAAKRDRNTPAHGPFPSCWPLAVGSLSLNLNLNLNLSLSLSLNTVLQKHLITGSVECRIDDVSNGELTN